MTVLVRVVLIWTFVAPPVALIAGRAFRALNQWENS